MPGFYVKHLKNSKAQQYATELEKRFACPTMDSKMSTVVTFHTTDKDDLSNVLHAGYAVLYDHPEFFYYRIELSATWDGSMVKLEVPLLYTLDEIKKLQYSIDRRIASIVEKIQKNMSAYEKERYLFEYLQTNTDYVDDGKKERHSIVGPLLCQKAVCEGISKTFAVLCHRVGVPCILVCSENHMWNVVNIDGTITNVDATFSTARDGHRCDYTYFNFSDNRGGKEHIKEAGCIPKCTDFSRDRTRSLFRSSIFAHEPRRD